jgi:hypothetical protein
MRVVTLLIMSACSSDGVLITGDAVLTDHFF